jgi:OOP family OmpA-OmpF porin
MQRRAERILRGGVALSTVLAFLSLIPGPAAAEPTGSYVTFSPMFGKVWFPEHIRFSEPGGVEDHFYAGGRLGFQVRPTWGLEFAGGLSPTIETFATSTPPTGPVLETFDLDFMNVALDLTFTPLKGRHNLFALLGGGLYQMNRAINDSRFRQWNLEGGLGYTFWSGDVVALRTDVRYLLVPQKDPLESQKDWIGTTIATGGLTFAIGASQKDADGDGVGDGKDECPATPAGATVDAKGCPIDSDGDQVADGIDQCANTPTGASVDPRGCPTDQDADNVFDGIDQCADTPKGATVDARGCPSDNDGDGVPEGLDQCANTPAGATVDANGCPTDADGDGVVDGIDKCPGTSPGLQVDATGCPIEVTERETELLDTGMIRLQEIQFATGKASLREEAMPQLDIIGQVLGKWPELRIEIGGHTDSRGTTAYNKKLSDDRVRAVLDYLVGKFPNLKRDQYTTVGYGESKPLVKNSSPENMAKNRRVEFKVLNTDVLKREIEHRKLLEKK